MGGATPSGFQVRGLPGRCSRRCSDQHPSTDEGLPVSRRQKYVDLPPSTGFLKRSTILHSLTSTPCLKAPSRFITFGDEAFSSPFAPDTHIFYHRNSVRVLDSGTGPEHRFPATQVRASASDYSDVGANGNRRHRNACKNERQSAPPPILPRGQSLVVR